MLTDEMRTKVRGFDADIVMGIPSRNNSDTIGHVCEALGNGAHKYFRKKKVLIVDSDNSTDARTGARFMHACSHGHPKLYYRYRGTSGKGSAVQAIFEILSLTKARRGMMVDADMRSIKPEWVNAFMETIEKGYDLAVPFYQRDKYDGTITTHICYPLVYGLLLSDIRQPIGGDFGFSKRMACYWLHRRWDELTAKFGIDIFMTSSAVLEKFRVAQVFLGAKVHDPKDPASNLKGMFEQVTTTFFDILSDNAYRLKKFKPKRVPTFSYANKKDTKVEGIKINTEKMDNNFKFGFKKKHAIDILEPETLEQIDGEIDSQLWSRIVYDSLYAHSRGMDVDKILWDLWNGRLATFVDETWDMGQERAEEEIKKQAKVFRKNRDYFFGKFE